MSCLVLCSENMLLQIATMEFDWKIFFFRSLLQATMMSKFAKMKELKLKEIKYCIHIFINSIG